MSWATFNLVLAGVSTVVCGVCAHRSLNLYHQYKDVKFLRMMWAQLAVGIGNGLLQVWLLA